jgi:hypothetical protein
MVTPDKLIRVSVKDSYRSCWFFANPWGSQPEGLREISRG